MSPGDVVLLVGPSGVATRAGWIYSQWFYFPPRAGGKVRIFVFYNNKKKTEESNLRASARAPI